MNGRASRRLRLGESGQMTIELVAMLPVLIVVVAIAVNALLFVSECAAFDRVARSAVRACAASPAYGEGIDQVRSAVQETIEEGMDMEGKPFEEVRVAVGGKGAGHTVVEATLEFSPTLFGLGLKREVLGVELPHAEHTASLVVDVYRPGVIV